MIIKELKEVISRPKFGFSEKQIDNAVKQIISISNLVLPFIKIDVIKEDHSDNMVLECAKSGKVDYIISCDDHLLKLRKYNNIKIIRTSDLLKLI